MQSLGFWPPVVVLHSLSTDTTETPPVCSANTAEVSMLWFAFGDNFNVLFIFVECSGNSFPKCLGLETNAEKRSYLCDHETFVDLQVG